MARFAASLVALAERHPRRFLTGVALLTRAPFAAWSDLSVDETRSVQMAQRMSGSAQVADPFSFDVQAPLFPLISVIQGAGGDIDGRWLRLVPVLASVATVPILYSLFRRWLGPREAMVGGLAAALSSFLIFYAKEARPYALAAFFFAAFLLAADRWRAGEGGRRAWIALPALAFGSVGSHFAALVTVGCFFLIEGYVALRARMWRPLGRLLLLGLVVGAALLPLLGMLLGYAGSGGLGFVGWSQGDITLFALLAEQLFFLFGNSLGPGLSGIHLSLLALAFPLLLSGARHRSEGGQPLPPIVALWWVPIASLVLLGWIGDRPLLYFPRAFLLGAPLLLLVFGLGCMAWWRGGWLRRAHAALVMALFLLVSIVVSTSSPLHPEYFGRTLIAEFRAGLAARLEPDDVVLIHHEILTSYIAYQWPGPQRVEGLGAVAMTATPAEREEAVRTGLRSLPADRRIVVVMNGVAAEEGLESVVNEELDVLRPRLSSPPCWPEDPEAEGLVCRRIWIYGPAEEAGGPPKEAP